MVDSNAADSRLILARDLALTGRDPRSIKGGLKGLRRGVYVDASHWEHAERESRHRLMIRAVAETRRTKPVFSHVSAAILWGIPIVGWHLDRVHLSAAGVSTARTKNGVVWHHDAIDDSEITEIDGVLATSFQRTVLDLARSLPFASAVTVIDHAWRIGLEHPNRIASAGVNRESLVEALAPLAGRRGVRAARAAVDFADPRSASPGESVSRSNIHLLHFPAPELQVAFPRPGGGNDIVDFDWPEFDAFGEFDGLGKYIKPEFLQGRTTQEAVALEKARENRIRKHRPFGARWDWPIAIRPQLLRVELLQAGLRPVR